VQNFISLGHNVRLPQWSVVGTGTAAVHPAQYMAELSHVVMRNQLVSKLMTVKYTSVHRSMPLTSKQVLRDSRVCLVNVSAWLAASRLRLNTSKIIEVLWLGLWVPVSSCSISSWYCWDRDSVITGEDFWYSLWSWNHGR